MSASPFPPQGRLSALWKKFALSTALATTVVSGAALDGKGIDAYAAAAPEGVAQLLKAGGGFAATETGEAAPATAALPAPPRAAPAAASRAERIRQALLEDAQAHFPQIAGGAQTSYSRDLGRLEQRLTAKVRADDGSLQDRVVILDPYRFDAATAIGFNPEEALKALLALQRASVPEERINELSDHMASFYITRMTNNAYGQDPAAFPSVLAAPKQACVIVPMSNFNQPLTLPGLNMEQRINFINRHEGWHCIDSRYRLIDNSGGEKGPKISVDEALGNDQLLADMATRLKKESLADVGAVGDMIRQDGMGLGLIDKIIAWRNNPDDVGHISTPALLGLKSAIQKMGLPAFQALSDAKAADLYYSLTNQYQPGLNGVRFALVLDNVSQAQRDDMAQRFGADPEFQKAAALRQIYARPVKNPGLFGGPLTAEEKRIAGEVMSWNASKLLQDAAFARARKITPASLIAAYATLQEGLMANMHAEPDNPVLPVLMTKLQYSFVNDVRNLDYLRVNAARGVDIVRTEPALARFAPRETPPRGIPMAGALPRAGVN